MAWKEQRFEELLLKNYIKYFSYGSMFVVEQRAYYEDLDDYDQNSIHVTYEEEGKLIAYARALPPDEKYENMASIGRVVVRKEARGTGIAQELLQRVLEVTKREWPALTCLYKSKHILKIFIVSLALKQFQNRMNLSAYPILIYYGNVTNLYNIT